MVDDKDMALPAEPDRAVVNGAACARRMQMQWSTDTGYVLFEFPSNLTTQDVEDVCELLGVAVSGMRRRADRCALAGEPPHALDTPNGEQ